MNLPSFTYGTNKNSGFSKFLLLVLFGIVFSSCENDIEKVSLITDKKALPVEMSTNLEILYSDSGKVKVKITAPELNRFDGEKPYTELPKGVNVEFYDDQLRVNSTLTSKYAIRKDPENIMEARKDVVVVNQKGEKLNTEHLVWDERKSIIYSKEFVKITTPDKIIFGDGFEANQNFTNYKIFHIKGTITINKDEHAPNP
ncbi:MAG TPA: LPS export ABC transporter periplasmic protein LptC [Bacteroidia bacterium]|nr:LPS export ABC transporter periplasmic protein LptC [Bacteroidia bacterium]